MSMLIDTSHADLLSSIDHLEFLTVEEVAAQLRLSKSAVYSLIHKGLLPVFRFGGAIRISRQQLDEFIQSSSYT